MHLVPAPAVRLMKRRVLSRPGVYSLMFSFLRLVIHEVNRLSAARWQENCCRYKELTSPMFSSNGLVLTARLCLLLWVLTSCAWRLHPKTRNLTAGNALQTEIWSPARSFQRLQAWFLCGTSCCIFLSLSAAGDWIWRARNCFLILEWARLNRQEL